MVKEYIPGDMFDIAGRVREIDPALVLSFDPAKEKYYLHRNDFLVRTINLGELDDRVLIQLYENDLQRIRLEDYILKLERSEEAAERSRAKEIRNKLEDVALDKYDRIVGIPHFSCGHWEG
jgi:hypothetical protein